MLSAVVTGANRGLGLETAAELAARGYQVWLTGRDPAQVEQAVAGLRARQLAVEGALLDVTSDESVARFAERLRSAKPIDALVNNAGATFQGFDAEMAARTIDANYRGALRVSDALRPRLSPSANIVMVSSGMGELAQFSSQLQRRLLSPALSRADVEQVAEEFLSAVARGDHGAAGFPSNAYSVSKALLNALTRVLAKEFAATKLRVNAVCPGWVKTRMGGSSAPRSLTQGASGIIWAATRDREEAGPNGAFLRDGKPIAW